MKKTLFSLLLVVVLAFALTGCWGSNDAPSDKPTPTATVSPSMTPGTIPGTTPSTVPGQSADSNDVANPGTAHGSNPAPETSSMPESSAAPYATAAPRRNMM